MNSMAREKTLVDAFSPDECHYLLQELRAFDRARWFHRTKINSRPTQGSTEADYYFCGDRQQPKEFNEYLHSLAPKIEGAWLAEACVNWYPVGSHMPEHVDIARYRYNMVVALNDEGDGVECSGIFVPDVPGRGIIFPARSEPHRVPPVKHERFVIIYLYE